MRKRKLTAADVWAMFAESRAEAREETERRRQENDRMRQENDRMRQENDLRKQENDRRMQENDRRMQENDRMMQDLKDSLKRIGIRVGGIDDNQGYHAEQFFQDVFEKKLEFGGMKYDEMVPNLAYKDKGIKIEFDIALLNGNSIALIEVKNRIHPNFVKELAEERVQKFREFFPRYGDCAVYLGIAGFSFCDEVLDRASAYGIGIIKQVGEGVEIKADNLRAY